MCVWIGETVLELGFTGPTWPELYYFHFASLPALKSYFPRNARVPLYCCLPVLLPSIVELLQKLRDLTFFLVLPLIG